MFVRKKKNKSGVISIQVIDKSSGKYKVIKTIGSSDDKQKVETLFHQGQQWIKNHSGQIELDFLDEKQLFQSLLVVFSKLRLLEARFYWVKYSTRLDLIKFRMNYLGNWLLPGCAFL